ncbi:hypothetical protein [Lysobacter capsici]|uniref:hypothetical protein n=1 Tax=Lysobacter capsici TaxID=435897 RepID=UPI00287BC407|nr:hypothetical protein [Lysobacter capsici]WND80402.1 hypothetical protein RJ610_24530 [Lysobacter capsici]WND85599.1 hypothetical protein RJ609_24550 [Lysobacter capsici]
MKRQTILLKRNLNAMLNALPLTELVFVALNGVPGVTSARVNCEESGGLIVSFLYGGVGLLNVPHEYFDRFGLLQPS